MGGLVKGIGFLRRTLITVIGWFFRVLISFVLLVGTYLITMSTIANPFEWQLWTATSFMLGMLGFRIYYHVQSFRAWYGKTEITETLLATVVRYTHRVMLLLFTFMLVAAIFLATVITSGIEALGGSAAETILNKEFWALTWQNPEWRADTIWNSQWWATVVTRALFDPSWWQTEVFPWVLVQAKEHLDLLNRLTGFSILMGIFYPILGSLVGIFTSGRLLLGIAFHSGIKATIQGVMLKVVSAIMGRHNHVPDKDLSISPTIPLFRSYRYEGQERGRIAVQLYQEYVEILENVEELEGEARIEAQLYVDKYLTGPFRRLHDIMHKRSELVHAIDDCLTEYDDGHELLEQDLNKVLEQLSQENLTWLQKRALKKQKKLAMKALAKHKAEYDGKKVWSNMFSRKKHVFISGKFQELYPAYIEHERKIVLPAIERAWGLLGDLETDMFFKFDLKVDMPEGQQRTGMLGYLKKLVDLAFARQEESKKQTELLAQLVQQTAPSKLPLKPASKVQRS